LRFSFIPNEDDAIEPVEHYRMIGREMKIKIPDGVDVDLIHPDHLALISLLCVHPFTRNKMIFPRAVSKRFHKATKIISRYKCYPVDENLEPWEPPEDSIPGLAYSGGVDSTAALAVMPPNTIPIFLDRPNMQGSLYDKSAALQSCKELSEVGFDVQIVECDVEYIREPIGFPTDVANAIPAITFAVHLGLDSISYGTILESSYGIGHRKFRDYPNMSHWQMWGGLFAAAGVPMSLPVGGVSEVGTAIIVEHAPIGFIAQSCIRGRWKEPCWGCWKCFRKGLLSMALNISAAAHPSIEELFTIKEARKHLLEIPIKHENVLSYTVQRLPMGNMYIDSLRSKIVIGDMKLNWLENWFRGSLDLMPENIRTHVERKLDRYLGKMSDEAVKLMSGWDLTEHINSESYTSGHESLINILS